VYKALEESLNRPVALKLLSPQLCANAAFVKRFTREARALASLTHPGIVHVYALGCHEGRCFFTMEYVKGPSLHEVLEREGFLPVSRAVSMARQIAEALAYAHSKGAVHRDIKPANILLEDSLDRVKVSDFGLVKLYQETSRFTEPGVILGTPAYMSPEQISGGDVGPASDVYSLGVVLYEMLTGQIPFLADTPVAMARQILDKQPQPARQINPEVPRQLELIISKAMSKKPAERFSSMDDFAGALERLMSPEPVPEKQPAPKLTMTFAAAAIAVIAMIAGLTFWLARPQPQAKPVVSDDSYRVATDVIPRASAPLAPEDDDEATGTKIEPAVAASPRAAGEEMKVDLGQGVVFAMVRIEPGEFDMGSPDTDEDRSVHNEERLHRVIITKPFYMGRHEVTQAVWTRVMGENPSEVPNMKAPVTNVSWNDCQEFISRINKMAPNGVFRLPTEAEREYACRAGTSTRRNRRLRLVREKQRWKTSRGGNKEAQPVGALRYAR